LIVIPIITLSVILIVNSTQTPGDIPERSPKSPGNYTIPSAWPRSDGLDYVELKSMLHKTPDENKAREWSQYYTTGAHLAGKNLSQAEWTRDKWLEFGVHHAELAEYDVYLNYPLEHQLQLLDHGKVTYRAALTEDVLEEDPTTGDENSIPTFHGYSANGNVTAPYVFCNYGTLSDYTDLQNANVSLAGKIALVKYGGNIFRSLKIKRAEDLGMIGVVMYTDPGDDGDITEEHGNKAYPDGPARHPSSVQRGSVMYLCKSAGTFLRDQVYSSKIDQGTESGIRQRLDILPNLVCTDKLSTTRFQRFHRYLSLSEMHCRF
jgi:N-acetylated-alpha-linked acidic dipeptidase